MTWRDGWVVAASGVAGIVEGRISAAAKECARKSALHFGEAGQRIGI